MPTTRLLVYSFALSFSGSLFLNDMFDWTWTSESSPSVGSTGESFVSGTGGGGVPFVRVLSTVSFGWMNPILGMCVGA